MEFLEAATLKHIIGNRSTELENLLSLGVEIADTLDAAHARGSPRHQACQHLRDQPRPRQDPRLRLG
jgi:hypothetical protein